MRCDEIVRSIVAFGTEEFRRVQTHKKDSTCPTCRRQAILRWLSHTPKPPERPGTQRTQAARLRSEFRVIDEELKMMRRDSRGFSAGLSGQWSLVDSSSFLRTALSSIRFFRLLFGSLASAAERQPAPRRRGAGATHAGHGPGFFPGSFQRGSPDGWLKIGALPKSGRGMPRSSAQTARPCVLLDLAC